LADIPTLARREINDALETATRRSTANVASDDLAWDCWSTGRLGAFWADEGRGLAFSKGYQAVKNNQQQQQCSASSQRSKFKVFFVNDRVVVRVDFSEAAMPPEVRAVLPAIRWVKIEHRENIDPWRQGLTASTTFDKNYACSAS